MPNLSLLILLVGEFTAILCVDSIFSMFSVMLLQFLDPAKKAFCLLEPTVKIVSESLPPCISL
jgi:hypothetical protein